MDNLKQCEIKQRYSNKRRSHIHFIKQYYSENEEYTGIRVVIFIKKKIKYIYDIGNFKKHKYKNPKSKINKNSSWNIVSCKLNKVVKKEMINYSEDGKLKMKNILYESVELNINEYYKDVFNNEYINISNDVINIMNELNI